jgi:hypothetical protein
MRTLEKVSITSRHSKKNYTCVKKFHYYCSNDIEKKRNEQEEINTINRTQAYDRHVMDARVSEREMKQIILST